jgi:hypothetical protein
MIIKLKNIKIKVLFKNNNQTCIKTKNKNKKELYKMLLNTVQYKQQPVH